MKFYFCEKCGKRITEKDIDRGFGKDKKLRGVYCKDCAAGIMTLETLPLTDAEARKVLRQTPASTPVPSAASAKRRKRRSTAQVTLPPMNREAVSVHCANPSCGAKLKVLPAKLGKRIRCPKCRQTFTAQPTDPMPAAGIAEQNTPSVPAIKAALSQAPKVLHQEPAVKHQAGRKRGANILTERKIKGGGRARSLTGKSGTTSGRDARATSQAPRAHDQFRRIPLWIEYITTGRPILRTALKWTLMVSAVVHLAFVPLAPKAVALGPGAKQIETEYQKKIQRAKMARHIAHELKGKITMPPPPPDPEGVVNEALATSLSSDVKKITSGVLNVELQAELTDFVKTSMKDELAAAKDIAEGKLSEEEIKALRKKFQEKAHREAVTWRKNYLVKHQVERAEMSTTEWYEKQVSETLFGNIRYELFQRQHGRMRWHEMFSGLYTGWIKLLDWSTMRSAGYLGGKLKGLDLLAEGKEIVRYKVRHPSSYPGPNEKYARLRADPSRKRRPASLGYLARGRAAPRGFGRTRAGRVKEALANSSSRKVDPARRRQRIAFPGLGHKEVPCAGCRDGQSPMAILRRRRNPDRPVLLEEPRLFQRRRRLGLLPAGSGRNADLEVPRRVGA